MGYINHDINIDFKLPKTLENTIKEAEILDAENNIEYICVADMIDVLAKQAYVGKQITKEQWDLLVMRYTY